MELLLFLHVCKNQGLVQLANFSSLLHCINNLHVVTWKCKETNFKAYRRSHADTHGMKGKHKISELTKNLYKILFK